MIRPGDVASATAAAGSFRAGGTDLIARRRLGIDHGEIVDLRGVDELRRLDVDGDGARIGAMVRVSTVAGDRRVMARYPALALTAGSLATPQIRAVATIGGNLLQRTRCPYYRHPELTCLKSGGSDCPARSGDHRHGVIFDLGPCVAPHPSSLAMVLLTYDGTVETTTGEMSVASLMGDGRDGSRDHTLPDGVVLTAVGLPAQVTAERAAYRRVTGRIRAEWPIVEAVCRLGVEAGRVAWAAVAVGGVAPVPLRLGRVEEALVGVSIDDGDRLEAVASLAVGGVSPLAMTGHKVPLLRAVVGDVIEGAIAGSTSTELAWGEQGLD